MFQIVEYFAFNSDSTVVQGENIISSSPISKCIIKWRFHEIILKSAKWIGHNNAALDYCHIQLKFGLYSQFKWNEYFFF